MAKISLVCGYEQAKIIFNACYRFDRAGGFDNATHPTFFSGGQILAVFTPDKITGDYGNDGNRIIEKSFIVISTNYYQESTLQSILEGARL